MNVENKVKYEKLKEEFNIIKLEFDNLIQITDDLCNELKESIVIDKEYYQYDNLLDISNKINNIIEEINSELLSKINENI